MTQVVFRSLKLSYSGKKAAVPRYYLYLFISFWGERYCTEAAWHAMENATGCFYSEAKPADAHVNPRELSWPPFAGQDHDYVYWERMKLTLTILRGKYTVPYTKGKAFEFNVQFLTSRLRDSFGPSSLKASSLYKGRFIFNGRIRNLHLSTTVRIYVCSVVGDNYLLLSVYIFENHSS